MSGDGNARQDRTLFIFEEASQATVSGLSEYG